MEKPLSLLYTGEIAGDLALLPRLFTFIQQLKAEASQPALALDLGGSCNDERWHCRETGSRSTLFVLDGMAYDAANVNGLFDSEARDRLAEQVTMALVDEERDWQVQLPNCDSIIRVGLHANDIDGKLQISLKPAQATRIEGEALFLQAVAAGQVGEALLDLRGAPKLLLARIREMPPDTPPNPSIAGTVEFVEAEARLLATKRAHLRFC